jgi:hypothetical protein
MMQVGLSTLSSSSAQICGPEQHSLHFSLTTDMHSLGDNSWTLTHASFGEGREVGNSGLYISGMSVGSGQNGYGAVVPHDMCADIANGATGHGDESKSILHGRSVIIESCYDLAVYDANGDGLSSPYAGSAGKSGFELDVDGTSVLEHVGTGCDGIGEEYEKCAGEVGFEYCAARVCTVRYDGAFSGRGGKADSYTLSTLPGSQCDLIQPQCDGHRSTTSIPLTIGIKTDSFGDELSWEVRISNRGDPKRMDKTVDNELLLAGGWPVYASGSSNAMIIGQLGVGVPMRDNERYASTACVPRNDDESSGAACYDFRAYDAYGDGLGCGADGSITIQLGDDIKHVQVDADMARRRKVDGETRMACMKEGEPQLKWNLCAVRVCPDGEIIGLEGNQCDFGMGDVLIDERYVDMDPLNGASISSLVSLLEFDPNVDGAMVQDFNPTIIDEVPQVVPRPQEVPKPQELPKPEEVPVVVHEKEVDEKDVAYGNFYDMFNFNPTTEDQDFEVIDTRDNIVEEEQYDTWAEYYEALDPGFRGDPETESENDIPLPMWAELEPRPNDQDNGKQDEATYQVQEDLQEEGPKDEKNEEGIDENAMGYLSESLNEYSDVEDGSFEPQVEEPKEGPKKNRSQGGPRAKSKKKESQEEESDMNVMGYVPPSLNEADESDEVQDIVTGDRYVWIDEDTDRAKRRKRRREDQRNRRAKSSKNPRAKSKKEKREGRMKRESNPKNEHQGLNVMGYVNGSQNQDNSNDSNKGYVILNGNIHTKIRMVN